MFERVTFTISFNMHPARQPVPNWTQLVPDNIRLTLEGAPADPAYQGLSTFRAQCIHLTGLPGISPYYAGKFLGVDPNGVRRQVEKGYGPRKPAGRPSVLNDEQVTAVTAFIRQRLRRSQLYLGTVRDLGDPGHNTSLAEHAQRVQDRTQSPDGGSSTPGQHPRHWCLL